MSVRAVKGAGATAVAERFVSVTGKGVVSSKVRNYAADPFFVRKAVAAKAEIDKVGLPKKSPSEDTFFIRKVEEAKVAVGKLVLPGTKKK